MESQTRYYTTVIKKGGKKYSGPRIKATSRKSAKLKAAQYGYISNVSDPLIEEQHPGTVIIE